MVGIARGEQRLRYDRPAALLGQFLPPLLLLWPLAATRDDQLYVGAGAALACAVVSLLSIAWRLTRPADSRGRLLRPAFTVLVAAFVLGHCWSERNIARLRINRLAQMLQLQCQQTGRCPSGIRGWDPAAPPFASQLEFGTRVRHRIVYRRDDRSFELRLLVFGEMGESSLGGVERPLRLIGPLPALDRR